MRILVDTNLLLRTAELGHTQHTYAVAAIKALQENGHEIVVVPQIVYEFWVVATRPIDQNGMGLSVERANAEIESILALYPVFDDETGIIDLWRVAVTRYRVLGKKAHDARLVAAMLRHGVSHLLTFNAPDFARYAEISAIAPEAASSFPPAAT